MSRRDPFTAIAVAQQARMALEAHSDRLALALDPYVASFRARPRTCPAWLFRRVDEYVRATRAAELARDRLHRLVSALEADCYEAVERHMRDAFAPPPSSVFGGVPGSLRDTGGARSAAPAYVPRPPDVCEGHGGARAGACASDCPAFDPTLAPAASGGDRARTPDGYTGTPQASPAMEADTSGDEAPRTPAAGRGGLPLGRVDELVRGLGEAASDELVRELEEVA